MIYSYLNVSSEYPLETLCIILPTPESLPLNPLKGTLKVFFWFDTTLLLNPLRGLWDSLKSRKSSSHGKAQKQNLYLIQIQYLKYSSIRSLYRSSPCNDCKSGYSIIHGRSRYPFSSAFFSWSRASFVLP